MDRPRILFAVLGITCLSPLSCRCEHSTIVRPTAADPRRVLYLAQAAGAIGDPRVALAIPPRRRDVGPRSGSSSSPR